MAASVHRNYHDSKFVHNIRLWGADAQRRLEQTHLLVLGCTATACQVVKSLVLPGASRFTLVDERDRADAATLQSNFFAYDDEGVGLEELSVAERCRRGLSALHLPTAHTTGVKGASLCMSPNEFVSSGRFAEFVRAEGVTFVIFTQMVSRANQAAAAKVLEGAGVMSLLLTVSGFVGSARLHSPQPIIIVETRSDMDYVDLRTWNPFPALQAWFDQHNPETAVDSPSVLMYIPWMCLIYHALRVWRLGAGVTDPKALPTTAPQWASVKAILTGWSKGEKLENFEEAEANCKNVLDRRRTRLMSTDKAVALAKRMIEEKRVPEGSVAPYVLVGLQAFRDAHDGSIPLRSKLPDFHTDTESYVCLSDIFKAQAAAEAAEVHRCAVQALTADGRDPALLPLSTVVAVCSGTPWDIGAVEWAPLAAELGSDPAGSGWYRALGQCHAFAADGPFPGSDVNASLPAVVAAVQATSTVNSQPDNYIEEVVRGGGFEPITTACLLGSAAAEEAIKMIQERMVPAHDALVYDGHTQTVNTVTI